MDLREDRAKPARVSGSIDLDLSKVTEQTAKLVQAQMAQTVAEIVMPALAQIQQDIRSLAGLLSSMALNDADAVATLTAMLPSGTPMPVEVAGFQHERLTEAGYAVVPVAGPALEHALRVAEYQRGERHPSVDRAGTGPYPPGSVEALQHAAGVDVEALRRADERLAQATRDPGDSWREDQ